MTQRLESLANDFAENGYSGIGDKLREAVEEARNLGAPEQFPAEGPLAQKESPKFHSEIHPGRELARQKLIIVERVIKPLGLNEQEALSQLPSIFPRRKASYDRLHLMVPLLSPQFKGISFLSACEAAGFSVSDYLKEQIEGNKLQSWVDSREVYIPNSPHGFWAQDGTQWVREAPVNVRAELETNLDYVNLRGGTLWEGFALALLRPGIVRDKGWNFIGDSVYFDRVPCLFGWSAGLAFSAAKAGHADWCYRAFVCGR